MALPPCSDTLVLLAGPPGPKESPPSPPDVALLGTLLAGMTTLPVSVAVLPRCVACVSS